MNEADILIIGCGIAGCVAALELAEKGFEVVLLGAGKGEGDSNSAAAQGGIIFKGEDDSEELLFQDIQEAGAGLCNPAAVKQLVTRGPDLVEELLIKKYEVKFDRLATGAFALTHEAAHSRPRLLFSRDQTGKAIMQALFQKVKSCPRIHVKLGHTAVDLITISHHSKSSSDIYLPSTCTGAYVFDQKEKKVKTILARETILATGGLGGLFLHTTNPQEARGDGVAMVFRAGGRIMNMEYVQFHPTALYHRKDPCFLLSETLRGEGGELLSHDLKPFMHTYDERGTLAPRDIVARSIYQEMIRTDSSHLWLDVSFRDGTWVKERFPFLHATSLAKGYDMTKEPLPIVPAAHYACGGVAVDTKGKTTIHRLRAIGEVACTGVHGANRLASTSLLEGVVWAKECAEEIAQNLRARHDYFPPVDTWQMGEEKIDPALIQQDWRTIRQTMWNYVGLIRDKQRLIRAQKILQELKWEIDASYEKAVLEPELLGVRNGVQTALLITQGALRNRSSRGCHFRVN